MTTLRRCLLVLAPLVTMVGCDHATKYLAKAELERQPPHEVLGSLLDLRYTENTDVAFNLLRWIPERARAVLLLALGGVAVLALTVGLLRQSGARAARVALVFITAGAMGNYLDRLLRGYVVDFIHVPHWPVFNVADVYVTAGLVVLAWHLRNPATPPAVSLR
jgi:signal peptidase II